MVLDRKRILASDNLPSLPAIALKVLELTRATEPDVKQLIATIKSDPALTAKVLRVANSSLFGLRHRVATIEHAVPLLGSITVRMVVLSFSLAAHTTQPGPIAEHYQLI